MEDFVFQTHDADYLRRVANVVRATNEWQLYESAVYSKGTDRKRRESGGKVVKETHIESTEEVAYYRVDNIE